MKDLSTTINESMKPILKSGQKVWMVEDYSMINLHNIKSEPIEVTIHKVGNKYFTLLEYERDKYNVETLMQETSSNYKNKVFLNKTDFTDLMHQKELYIKIKRDFFDSYSDYGIPLEKLKKIQSILY